MGEKSKRQRIIVPKGEIYGSTQWVSTDGLKKTTGTHASALTNSLFLTGIQYTESENHPEWRRPKNRRRSDIGGEFYSEKTWMEDNIPLQACTFRRTIDIDTYTEGTFKGPCVAFVPASFAPPTGYLPFQPSSDASLRAAGTTAIARCKPTNSTADLATALGELHREGLPHLLGSKTWKARTLKAKQKSAAGDYLSYQFGFKPLANEIASFAAGVVSSGDLLDQYIADAGKVVRRGYEFPPTEQASAPVIRANRKAVTGGTISDMSVGLPAAGTVTEYVTTVRRRWFKGAFTYELPSWFDNNPVDRERLLAQKILGLELTPNTLWNLAPWTWAADWFTNTGDVISNLTDWAVDGLSLRYGYIMEHTVSKRKYVFDGPTGYRGLTIASPITLVTETKVRKKATPFGFGTTWDTLTPTQAAILAALGISRGK